MKLIVPARVKLASQKMRTDNSVTDYNQETELSEIITSITGYADEFLENEIKYLSKNSRKALEQRFLEEKNHILAQLELITSENWDEAITTLNKMIEDLEALYEREINYFNQRKLVGLSAALEKSKKVELKLFSDLHRSIINHSKQSFLDGVETNEDFNQDFVKYGISDAHKSNKNYYEEPLPKAPNATIESLGWILQVGLSAATYTIKESIRTVDHLVHKKNITHNVTKLAGGVLGAVGGGVAAYFTAGALVGGAIGTVAPIVGTIVGTLVGAFIGAAMGFRAARMTSRAASKAVTGDPNPEKWQLNREEQENLLDKQFDLGEVQNAINAIRAEKDNAKDKICNLTVEKEQAVVDKLNDDLVKIKAGQRSNYKLGGKVFCFFNRHLPVPQRASANEVLKSNSDPEFSMVSNRR